MAGTLTLGISARRGLSNGLVAGAVIIFFILIGIPGGTGTNVLPEWFAWLVFVAVTAAFGFAAARARNVVEQRGQSFAGSLVAGLVAGVVAGIVTVLIMLALNGLQLWEMSLAPEDLLLANGKRASITRTQDIFANVTPRTTAVMAGMDEAQFNPREGANRADPIGGFVRMALLLPVAGMAGGALSFGVLALRKRREDALLEGKDAQAGSGTRRAWLQLAMPVGIFFLIVLNRVLPEAPGTLGSTYRSMISGNGQLFGLILSFLLLGTGLIAVRSATGGGYRGPLAARIALLCTITVVFFAIGLAAPQPAVSALMFGEKAPNLTQIVTPGGVQVVPEVVPSLEETALRDARAAFIVALGALFLIGGVLNARGSASLHMLVALNTLLCALVITPLFLDIYQQSVLLLVGINVLLGLGLNVVVGYAGLLDLGYVAYYAIGAYTYGFAVSNQDVREGATVVGLRFAGNDQMMQDMAAAFILTLFLAPAVVTGGLWLWHRVRSQATPRVPDVIPIPRRSSSDARPGWLGYVLVAASVIVVQAALALLRGTPFYESFAGFPLFIMGMILSMIVAAGVGTLLGVSVLRLRGDYLAIVTLGFGEIVRLMLNNLRDITGGPQGVVSIPRISFGPLEMGSNEGMLYLVLFACMLMAFVAMRLKASRQGRAWGAVRSDEDIAQAMGINPFRSKVLAYGFSAALAAVAGVIFASRQASIFPDNFTLAVSINVLSLVIIGGMGSVPGVIVGALVLIGVPESLRVFESYRVMVFGALLVTMMILRPRGILPEPPYPLEQRAKALVQEGARA